MKRVKQKFVRQTWLYFESIVLLEKDLVWDNPKPAIVQFKKKNLSYQEKPFFYGGVLPCCKRYNQRILNQADMAMKRGEQVKITKQIKHWCYHC